MDEYVILRKLFVIDKYKLTSLKPNFGTSIFTSSGYLIILESDRKLP